jgi:hypothetical protein
MIKHLSVSELSFLKAQLKSMKVTSQRLAVSTACQDVKLDSVSSGVTLTIQHVILDSLWLLSFASAFISSHQQQANTEVMPLVS